MPVLALSILFSFSGSYTSFFQEQCTTSTKKLSVPVGLLALSVPVLQKSRNAGQTEAILADNFL